MVGLNRSNKLSVDAPCYRFLVMGTAKCGKEKFCKVICAKPKLTSRDTLGIFTTTVTDPFEARIVMNKQVLNSFASKDERSASAGIIIIDVTAESEYISGQVKESLKQIEQQDLR